tara:strand:+ start:2564 stop:3913 length:1350 start_codon:yes stop_codon:yes gene_type:complete
MKKKFSLLVKEKIKKFNKSIDIPGDKSLSIRALLLASQCIGESQIKNLLESEDVLDCKKALEKLGVKITKVNNIYKIYGNGLNSFKFKNKKTKIYVGNSGTTARLLSGLLATTPGKFYLYGDSSMNKRDMRRVSKPLEKIGCFFHPKNKSNLPLLIEGTTMPLAQTHLEKLGSAQVKSSILLAALNTSGTTSVIEKKTSRNHTEIFLKKIGANIKVKKLKKGNLITLEGQKNLYGFKSNISSDPSSSAFFIALTLLTPGSKLLIKNVNCNSTRIGFVNVLKKKMNANIIIKFYKKKKDSEPVGNIIIKSSKLKPINCPKEIVPNLIDEFPILFVLSALTKGVSKFSGIESLREKESDRIKSIEVVLNKIGIKTKSTTNSLKIFGNPNIKTTKLINVYPKNDHRIAMSSAILSLLLGVKLKIANFETTNTSFPGFISIIKYLGGKVEIKK